MKQRNRAARLRLGRIGRGSLALVALSLVVGVTTAQAQTKAYLANGSSNVATVLDTSNDAVLSTVPVGANPSQVAVSKDGLRAYVSNTTENTVSVIDTATDAVIGTIPVGAGPSVIAATPNGEYVYVAVSGGIQVISTALNSVVATVNMTAGASGIAITPDGSRVYVAGGDVTVIDTATNTITSTFRAEAVANPNLISNAVSIAISPNGTRAYVTNFIFNFGFEFNAAGNVAVMDTSNNSFVRAINLFRFQPGPIALAPDGTRVYVGIQSEWVNTGYGAGFLPASAVATIDASSNTLAGWTELGGVSSSIRNTPAYIAVTQDRSDVYVSIPRISSVAVISTSATTVRLTIPVAASPGGLAMKPDPSVTLTPYLIDAVDDNPAAAVSSAGGVAVANVLANDTLGAAPANLTNVTLSQVSSTNEGITLNPATGSVDVAAGTQIGTYSLVYTICESTISTNCDTASVTVTVRDPYVIDAVADSATSVTGRVAVANVLANDTLAGLPATIASVIVTQLSSTNPGVSLNPADGSVAVAAGTPVGSHTLTYQICERASLINCDTATVTINVIPFAIDAVNDAATSPRTGGIAVANVLVNDRFNGAAATLTNVSLTQVSSTNAGITLNPANGSVAVAAGTTAGTHTLTYRICERASPGNCDSADVTITVAPYVITAVNDSARASSKVANIALTSVLSNDRLGNSPATPANVVLSFVSLSPANPMIRLNLPGGSVEVLGKTDSGTYTLVYQICEAGNPSNCSTGTVTLSLSGK